MYTIFTLKLQHDPLLNFYADVRGSSTFCCKWSVESAEEADSSRTLKETAGGCLL